MAEETAKLQDQPDSFKAHHVPLDKRESQNVKPGPFITNYIVILGLTAVGAAVGFFTGKALEPRNIKLGKLAAYKFATEKVDRQAGLIAGTEVGAIWGVFHHWKKAEGKQIGIKNLSTDLRAAMDPAQLEKETQKEETLAKDLQRLENQLNKPKSHSGTVLSRREEPREIGISS